MRSGRRLADLPDLTASRAHAKDQLARLPGPLARLEHYHYPVEIGTPLRELGGGARSPIGVNERRTASDRPSKKLASSER
jgi:hypothetical protein